MGSVVFGWRALRPPRVVFVLGFVSLINSLTSGKKHQTLAERQAAGFFYVVNYKEATVKVWAGPPAAPGLRTFRQSALYNHPRPAGCPVRAFDVATTILVPPSLAPHAAARGRGPKMQSAPFGSHATKGPQKPPYRPSALRHASGLVVPRRGLNALAP